MCDTLTVPYCNSRLKVFPGSNPSPAYSLAQSREFMERLAEELVRDSSPDNLRR
ncbi:MAG: hypothetical protein H6R08_2116, partial [Proteobacteria bacterium]|nr:hypothetical protein [Pseudomonadota bacterium]